MLSLALLPVSAIAATVRFLSPAPGAQVIGPTVLEVTTDAAEVDRVEFFVDGTLAGVVRRPPFRITFDFGASLEAHHIVAKVSSRRFQQTDVAELGTSAVGGESITVRLVEVPLRIRTPTKVSGKDLEVVEDGVRQTVRDVFAERQQSRFVFLIDRSQSMNEGKLEGALSAVDAALELLRPGDTAHIIFFNHNLGRLEELRRSERASTRFAAMEPSGGTSLRDALVSTITSARTHTIAVTDGTDRHSETSEEKALRRISGTNGVFFALVFEDASRFLKDAAQNTGGEIRTVSVDTVRGAMADLIDDINSRYTLTYQSSGTKRGWRSIAIRSARSDVKVLKARKGYFAE